MTKVIVFTTHYDKSAIFFLPFKIYHYEHLHLKNRQLYYHDKPLLINKNIKIILRDPYNTGINYSPFLRFILHTYFKNIFLDCHFLNNNPFYEDKLQQNSVFDQLQLPTPQIFWNPCPIKKTLTMKFPCLLKKRYSSRGRHLRKIYSWEDYQQYFASKQRAKRSDYLIQEFINIKEDWRILVLKGKILGAVRRQVGWKENGRLSLLVKEEISKNKISAKLRQQIKKLVCFLKIDFVGIDVIFDHSKKHYFLECNFSPQFKGFLKVYENSLGLTGYPCFIK